jgi:hypothetical protein
MITYEEWYTLAASWMKAWLAISTTPVSMEDETPHVAKYYTASRELLAIPVDYTTRNSLYKRGLWTGGNSVMM